MAIFSNKKSSSQLSTFLCVIAFLVLSVRTQPPSPYSNDHLVTARSSFWTMITEPPATPPLRGGNDPCRIAGSVQLAGDASSTNSYYVYKNLYEDTKPGSVIGRLDFASARPDLVILSRMQNERSAIGWDRLSRNFTLLRSLNAELVNTTGQETQVVFRCMPRDNTNMVYYIFYLFNVIDVNDNPPAFSHPVYYVKISEAAPIGTIVTNDIVATDADGNSQLTYWIADSPDAHFFLIDSSSGQVTVGQSLDYEYISSANLTIWVKDTPSWCDLHEHPCVVNSASAILSISVVDIDDQPPVFTAPIYYGSVPANATYGTLVSFNHSILATDGDMFISIPIVYSLHPTFLGREDLDNDPRPYLMINERTAEVYVVRQLPTSVDELVYTVKAAQMNNSAKSSVAMLRVSISKHNIRFVGRSRFEIDVVESAAPKSRIFYAPIMIDSGGPISYSIYGRDPTDSSLLTIDPYGLVTFTQALTYTRAKSRISYIITAVDGQQQSATAELVINVQPTFTRLPRFAKERFIFNISSRDVGTVVGKVDLAPVDVFDPSTVNFTYAIHGADNQFKIDQTGVIRVAKYLTIDQPQIEITATAWDMRRMGDAAVINVFLPLRAGSAIEQRGSSDMSSFLVYILAAVAVVLISVVLALGIYLLRSEKQIREMQRRLLGTTIDADSHVKWLHGGGPSTSSGELGPVNPAILRTNEAYQRFLEGGSSEEVQSSGAESLDSGRNHTDRDKMSILPPGVGGMSSGYSSTASPPAPDQLSSIAVTANSALPNHHPFAPQTPPKPANNNQHQRQQMDNFASLAGLVPNNNISNSAASNNNKANAKRRYKKKYENPLNVDYGLEPYDDNNLVPAVSGGHSNGVVETMASPTAIGIATTSTRENNNNNNNKLPPLPPKPRQNYNTGDSDGEQPSQMRQISGGNNRKNKFFDSVFGRFLPTASSLGQTHDGTVEPPPQNGEVEHAAPPVPPPLPTVIVANNNNNLNHPNQPAQYSVIVEHVAIGPPAIRRAPPASHHGYINDAIFVPPPSLPLPSVTSNVNNTDLAANAINRYLLDGRTIAY